MKRNNRKYLCAALAGLTLILLTGCGTDTGSASSGAYNAHLTQRGELQNTVTASGTVEGSDAFSITSDLLTKVTKLNVSVGSAVKEGDILCEFDQSDFQRQIDTLTQEMELTNSRMQAEHGAHLRDLSLAQNQKEISLRIAQREIDEAVSKRDYARGRYQQLGARKQELESQIASLNGEIAAAEDASAQMLSLERAEKELATVSADYTQIESSLVSYDNVVVNAEDKYSRIELECDYAIEAAYDAVNADAYQKDTASQLKMDELQNKLKECTVVAPRDGIITSLSVKEGSIPTTDSIMTIADDSSLVINATVYENDILKVFEGQNCEISMIANAGKNYDGKILSVVKIRDDKSTDSAMYSVRISIDNSDDAVIIGMSTQINIITERKSDIIAVPYEAIGSDENGSEYVFVGVKESDGTYTAKRRSVESGMETSYLSEISGDVEAGEKVLFPTEGLADGDKIIIKDVFSADSFGN